MNKPGIEVRRVGDFPGVELHQGTSVIRQVAPHWHSEFQICLITGGGGDLLYRGVRHPTPAGTMFAIHPGETHANETSWADGCTYRTLNLDAGLVAHLSSVGESFWLDPFVEDDEVLRSLLHCYDVIDGESSRLEMESSLLASLTALISRHARRGQVKAVQARAPRGVKMVREFLTENHDRNVSLSELAGLAGLSPFHLAHSFTAEMGMPPHRFHTQIRLERAKTLLRQGWRVARVAAECGFADQSHLIRRFKRLVGVTPDQYRGRRGC
jgi:AraC-like DNA-binding protein